MKLTLRKAHRLVKELQAQLRIDHVRKNIHRTSTETEVEDAYTEVANTNRELVEQSLQVVNAISEIRVALQAANSTIIDGISIDTLLNDKVRIENQMRVLAGYAIQDKKTDVERLAVLQRQVKDAAENVGSMVITYVAVHGLSSTDHNAFNEKYVQLKRDQEVVSDKLAYINNKLEIELDNKYQELFKVLQVL